MGSLVGNIFGNEANKSADETIAISAISAASASASAYLMATLDSTTPEVRRLFSDYCTQSVIGQEVLTSLALKKGWISPYDSPKEQLHRSVTESYSLLSTEQ